MKKHQITPVTILGSAFNTMVIEGSIPLNDDEFRVTAVIFSEDPEAEGPRFGRNPQFRKTILLKKSELTPVTEAAVIDAVEADLGVQIV